MDKLYLYTWDTELKHYRQKEAIKSFLGMFFIFAVILTVFLVCSGCAMAQEIIVEPNIAGHSLNQWCEAIHKAEGNDNYGILVKFKHTTPLQACRNTILHKYRLWKKSWQQEAFVAFLGASYAPVGTSNDPNCLNKNWVANVSYWLERV